MEDERNAECICNIREVIKKLETANRHIAIAIVALSDVDRSLRGPRKVRLKPEPTGLVPPEPTGLVPSEPTGLVPSDPAGSASDRMERLIAERASGASSSSPRHPGSRAGRSPSP